MTLSPDTVAHVQRTWADVAAIAPEAASLFYHELFDAAPHLRPLFRGDMEVQGRKLMDMIGVAVATLDRPATLGPVLAKLGRRHGEYGVEPDHYGLVGAALLATLAAGLGEAFTDRVEAAWTEVYGALADAMITAAGAPNGAAVATSP